MTVRWKPLLVLSGLFAVIAVVGLIAMAFTLVPRGASEILATARAERAKNQYEKAEIHFKQARQMDGKNPSIHEEMAGLYDDWSQHAPVEKQAGLRALRFAALAEATKYGKTLKEPRRLLLSAAMLQDEVPEAIHWAKDLLAIDSSDADARYVLASEALEDRSATAKAFAGVLPDVKRHLKALAEAKAPDVRIQWLEARLAQVAGDADGGPGRGSPRPAS